MEASKKPVGKSAERPPPKRGIGVNCGGVEEVAWGIVF